MQCHNQVSWSSFFGRQKLRFVCVTELSANGDNGNYDDDNDDNNYQETFTIFYLLFYGLLLDEKQAKKLRQGPLPPHLGNGRKNFSEGGVPFIDPTYPFDCLSRKSFLMWHIILD